MTVGIEQRTPLTSNDGHRVDQTGTPKRTERRPRHVSDDRLREGQLAAGAA